MSRAMNLAVSTSLPRCPRCGLPCTDRSHLAPVNPAWTASQMYNDPDKISLCRFA